MEKYLMFQGEPFAEEDFGTAIEEIQDEGLYGLVAIKLRDDSDERNN